MTCSRRVGGFARSTFRWLLALGALLPVAAQASLSVTPLTWNIVGLDSNSPATGPHLFPVGARVCSTVATTNVAVNFVFDSANANVNLRAGSLSTVNLPSIGAGLCADAYFEVDVTQVAAAYDTTRRYHITATDFSGSASTAQPRELYVEHLISQNRNSITNVRYGPTPASLSTVAAGGSMNLVVGNTYTIELSGGTATQGYEQFEAFINFANTIFQITSVSTTYSANTSIYVTSPNDKLYANACLWENDPNNPNYRSCVGTPGKTGGSTVVTTYTVKILSGGGTSQTLNTLLYDFSGSSFHYNADYSTGARVANIIDPTTSTLSKSFSPSTTTIGGVSALTFTINNPNAGAVSGYNFVDNLPPGLVVANPSGATSAGCGAPTITAVAGSGTISVTGASAPANGRCNVTVNVTAPAGTYNNTSNHLFVDTNDTGSFATATLNVSGTTPPGTGLCGVTVAKWDFTTGFSLTAPAVSSSTVTATAAAGAGVTPLQSTDSTLNPVVGTNSWGSNGNVDNSGTTLNTANNDYFEFVLNTTGITNLTLQFDSLYKTPNGPKGIAVFYGTASLPGTSVFNNATAMSTQNTWNTFGAGGTIAFANANLNASGNTTFRIYTFNAGNQNSGSDFNLDHVVFTGCGTPVKPTIAKAFTPAAIAVNGTSTLTFTLTNTNSTALTGAKFTDALPPGVQVAATPAASTTCGVSPTWAPAAGNTTLNFGQVTGATIPASGSCTASVNVTITAAGPATNISSPLTTTEAGTNATNVATATLTGVLPPTISKLFGPNPILAGGVSTLTFTISNPNQNVAISGLGVTDTYPAGLVNAATPAVVNGCGGVVTATGGANSFSLSGGGPLAGGTSCTVSVNVTAAAANTYNNTSGNVSHVINAQTVNGNTASASLVVTPPHPSIGLKKQIGNSATGPWADYDAVTTGSNVFYRFTIENTGDVPLSPVSITDNTLNVSTCNASWPATLPVAVAANENHIASCVVGAVTTIAGTHVNIAHSTGTFSATPYNSPDSDATYATMGLSLTKTAGQTVFRTAGDTLTYTYVVTNSGAAVLSGPVTVADDHTTVTCPALTTIGDLDNFFDPGEAITCTSSYVVTAGDVAAKSITNIASASAGGATSPNASATVPLAPDLSVNKTNDVGGAVTLGNTFHWTITVTNAAAAGSASFAAAATLLSDDLPTTGATYSVPATATNAGGTTGTIACSISANTLSCVASGAVAMPAGASFSIIVTVTPTINGSLANPRSGGTCLADPGTVLPEINEGNNACPPNTVTVAATPKLVVDKVAGAPSFVAGGTGSYTLTVSNTGTLATSGTITITDTLPAGLSVANGALALTGANAANWSCSSAANTITCTSSTVINTAGTSVFGFTVNVAPNAPSSVTNNVAMSGGGDPTCPAGTPCSDPTPPITPITRATALVIAKSDGTPTYTPGGTATYVLTVTNTGPSTATAIVVGDTLPGGVTLSGTPTCVVTGTAACGTITGAAGGSTFGVTGATLAPGAGNSLVYSLPVAFAANLSTDPLVNSATASDPNDAGGTHTANDSDTRTPVTDLTLSKTDGQSIYTPGGSASYVITVGNNGPTNASAVTLNDPLPAGVTLTGTPTCVATGTAACGVITGATGGTTFSVANANVAAGAGNTLAYTVPVAFGSGMSTNPLVNTATVTATGQVTPVSASDSDTLQAVSGLTIAKTDGSPTYTPGGTATYTITVDNAGPTNANNITVADTLPAGVTLAGTPSCAVTGSALCGTVTGASGGTTFGATGAQITAGAGNLLTYSLPVAFAPGLLTTPLVNTATATDPSDPSPNTATDSDTRSALTALTLTKTDGATTYTPGTTATYTLTLTNAGPSVASNVAITDTLPAGVTLSAPPSCTPNNNATCGTVTGATGGSNLGISGATLGVAVGDSIVLSVPVNFASTLTVNPLINTATASDPGDPDGASASDSDALQALSGLSVSKNDGATTYTPGGTATYAIVVTNAGPSNANAVTLTDPLPPGVTLTGTPTCVPTGSATCGSISGSAGGASFGVSGATIGAGAGNQLAYSVPVAFAANLVADPLSNSVTASDPSDPTSPTATDTDTRNAQAGLTISKTDGKLTYTPGGSGVYTIVVGNSGPSDALNVTLTDNLPAGLTLSGAPTCTPAGNANCGTPTGTAGGTSYSLAAARVAAGAGNTLTLALPVAYASAMSTDPLVNTVTATDPAQSGGVQASDSDSLQAIIGLTLTKSDSSSTYTPGGTGTYVVIVTNAGPTTAGALSVNDTLPAGVTLTGTPTCIPTGSATCGTIAGSAGGTSFSVSGATLPAGAPNGLGYSLPVAFAPSLTADPLVNTATASDVSDPTPATGSDSDTRASGVNLTLTKSDGNATYLPGGSATYVVTVRNTGTGNAGNVNVGDTLPAGVTLSASVTCTPLGAATCGTTVGSAGGGSFTESGGTINAGAANGLQFSVPVNYAANLTADPLINTATATDPDAISPATGSDSDTRAANADVSIVKSGPANVIGGAPMTYTLLIDNAGASAADGATYHDALPVGITGVTANCSAPTGGASCAAPVVTGNDGSGWIVDGTVPSLPVGGTITITINGNAPTGPTTTLANTATVSTPGGTTDSNPSNNSSSTSTTTPVTLQNFEVD